MNFISSLAAWQWAVLLAVPPAIILLYFLKLKRKPLEVPSTYLWSRTIEDLHVNTIWQRLRRNLLLLLQLLLIALVMFALLRPGRRGSELTGERFIFLVDTSASMNATDVAPSRLEKAREILVSYIDEMESGDVAMIISFSDTARIEQNYTDSRRELRRKALSIRPTNRTSNLLEALRAAAGLANPGYSRLEGAAQGDEALPATIYILSDGAFPTVTDFSLGNLQPVHVRIGSAAPDNVAITAFSADRNPDDPNELEVFSRIENFGPADTSVQLELKRDDVVVDVKEVDVPAGGASTDGFRLTEVEQCVLTLSISHDDALALDNTTFAAINRPQRARVLFASPGNEAFETALQTTEAQKLAFVTFATPEELKQETMQQQCDAGAFDLVIYDRCAPERLPLANTLFIGAMPPGEEWTTLETGDLPAVIDVDRTHPLMQFVQFDDVLGFLHGFAAQGPEGSRTLVDSTIGPALVIGPRQGLEDAVFGLPLFWSGADGNVQVNTDWPRRQSFPVFVINALRYLGRVNSISNAPTVQPGTPLVLRTELPVEELTVTDPDGNQRELRREGQNAFVYTDTERLGVYQLREGEDEEVDRRFTVNLFDSRESNLNTAEIEIGHEKVQSKSATVPARLEYWKWILLAALALLLFEWWVFNRRVYV